MKSSESGYPGLINTIMSESGYPGLKDIQD